MVGDDLAAPPPEEHDSASTGDSNAGVLDTIEAHRRALALANDARNAARPILELPQRVLEMLMKQREEKIERDLESRRRRPFARPWRQTL